MLLRWLAPIVMAYLAKRMFDIARSGAIAGEGSQSASPQVLGDILGQEHQRVSRQGGTAGGLLGAVLDRDGDGDVDFTDLLKAGGLDPRRHRPRLKPYNASRSPSARINFRARLSGLVSGAW